MISALKVSLFFLVSFLLMGKPLIWSCIIATISGLATWWIVNSWMDNTLPSSQELTSASEKLEQEITQRRQKKQRRQKSSELLISRIGQGFLDLLDNLNSLFRRK